MTGTGTAWLADYRRRLEELGTTLERARSELADLTATGSSASGAVTVTVGPDGSLQQVGFSERADELSRPMLAEAVLEAAHSAQAAAARRSAQALRPLIGGAEASRFLAAHLPPDAPRHE